ncbi:endoplasmic reticulum metallopeptidase [Chloropicon primus]|uniref:Endoplasmic reticulum metallopeptidase n=1 Tax=Chloropicon primus TaxID=1764295 RepID=A0A5B8N0C0_9CHLO|nr:endoplasmic reticulum metallopeptidase [Chloropicon primus]UPR04932.1 endoplasmic reticulum metallopeptidase [Chloropicon primus]|eukprot:QDZ25736.1 endoplasmic reticulum metallopeptidase [Chloropicon primus]
MGLLSGGLKVAIVYALLIFTSYKNWHHLPQPFGEDANQDVFSEHRAMNHVRALADDIGMRQVGTPGVRIAAEYLLSELKSIEQLAKRERPDLEVEIQVQTTSGAYHLELFLTPVYLSYANLENLLIRLRPKASSKASERTSLLVNAHFDSAIASPGAADCAACTAIAVEVARTIVGNKDIKIETPVIFLLNGGEETYMNAAHGFMIEHEWAQEVSHFINIESTGSYGPDVVFRSNSDLLLSAYLSASPRPRANVVFQDIFDLGLIPAETDYAVFAHESTGSETASGEEASKKPRTTVYGDLPGIDIATMFDSRSYHTALDESKRMAPGCTQNFGDNMLAIVLKASEMIRRTVDDEEGDSFGEDCVYFDVMGLFVVAYPFKLARFIHLVPFVLTVAVTLAAKASGSKAPVVEGVLSFFFSFLCSVIFAVIQFGLTALFIQPMAWYGRPHIAALLLVPSSVFGSFIPYIFTYTRQRSLDVMKNKDGDKLEEILVGHVVGSSLVLSTLALLMTTSGVMKHSAYMFVFWVLSALLALGTKVFYFRDKRSDTGVRTRSKAKRNGGGFDSFDVMDTLVIHLPALVVVGHMSLFGFLFFLDRISTMGSSMDWHGRAHADMIIGVIAGGLFFVSFGPLVPFLAYHAARSTSKGAPSTTKAKKSSRAHPFKQYSCVIQCLGGLLAMCLFFLLVATVLIRMQDHRNSFSAHNPKRVFVQRLHVLRGDPPGAIKNHSRAMYDTIIEESSVTMLGVDSVPLQNVLNDMVGAQSHESGPPKSDPNHLLAAYPITRFMKDSVSLKVGVEDEEIRQLFKSLPSLRVRTKKGSSMKRCHIAMRSPFAGYYLVNVTGNASKFSFAEHDTEPLIPSEYSDDGLPMYAVRHVGNHLGGRNGLEWNWWIDAKPEENLKISWAVSNITSTPTLQDVVARLPDYVNPIPITTILHKFEC